MKRVSCRLQRLKSRAAGLWSSESGDAPSQVMIIGVAAMILFAVITAIGVNATGEATGGGIFGTVLGWIGKLLGGAVG